MELPTYLEMKTKIEQDLDLEEETFIQPSELLGLFNEALDMIESTIHTLYEDYFLVPTAFPLTGGTALYDLPSNIYAQKIRAILFDDGSNKYEIKRIKHLSNTMNIQSTEDFRYVITNDQTNGVQLKMYPTPSVSDSSSVSFWYLRNVTKFSGADGDVCDIPEFSNVILQYVRWKCHLKESHPDTSMDLSDLNTMKNLMVETLRDRVPDEDTFIAMDLSFYEDFDMDLRGF